LCLGESRLIKNSERNCPVVVNLLMGILNPHSNGPLYSNTVIGTLAADGWAVTFGTARIGLG